MVPIKSDDPDLVEMHERWDYATEQWREIRAEGRIDMRYISGDPWDPHERRLREDAGRPVISVDELTQYVNQLINETRQYKRAIRVTPIGYGANDKTAEVIQDLIRQIEYRSNAQMAYTTMFENTVQRSYGFLRIRSKFVGESWDQELLIEPVVNPDLVTMDPDVLKPDGSDMKYAFVHERWTLKEYQRKFPKADVQSFDPGLAAQASQWMDPGHIQIAEYWTVEQERRTKYLIGAPPTMPSPTGEPIPDQEIFSDEFPEGMTLGKLKKAGFVIKREREVETPKVVMRLTNGFEWLHTSDEPGESIPLVFCPGKVLYVDDGSGSKRRILSLIRLARDPQMALCYLRSSEIEVIGRATKNPYFGYEGQATPETQNLIAKSLHEPVAYLGFKATVEGVPPGVVLDLPKQNNFEPPIQALEIASESTRRAIQAAIGTLPLPTPAQRKNEKSGVALQEIEKSAQRGSFHFVDHFNEAIARTGVILNEKLPFYYDTARDVTVRTETDETSVQRVNDPNDDSAVDLGVGLYDVTISTGPAMDSEREAASEFADALMQTEMAPLVADLAVKLKNVGPIGDKISERLFSQLPPQIQQREAEDGDPQAMISTLQQQLEQAKAMMQQLSQELEARTKIIETEQVKAQAQVELKSAEANTKAQLEMAKMQADTLNKMRELEVKLELGLADIGSALAMKRGELEMQQLHQHDEATLRREELEANQAQAEMDRQADRDAATAESAEA